MTIVAGVLALLETSKKRDKRKRKKDTSVSAQYQKMEVVCKQEKINEEYIQFATWLATIMCTLPTAIAHHHLQSIQLEDCNMPIERSKRNRENEAESEIQGRGDTVKQFNQEHTTKKKTKDKDKCEMENKKRKKSFWKPV